MKAGLTVVKAGLVVCVMGMVGMMGQGWGENIDWIQALAMDRRVLLEVARAVVWGGLALFLVWALEKRGDDA